MTVSETSPLAPLRHTTFRLIWTATLVSNFGTLVQGVGAAWLMTSISDSVDMVALVQASTTLPLMLFSLFGGAIADNFDRRLVILGAQLFMLVVSAVLAVLAYLGMVSPWMLLTFTFLIGSGTAINNPAYQATVGDLVPRRDLPGAVALNSIGFNLSRSLGPAIGGAIVAAVGAAGAFAANALSYVSLVIVLLRWRPAVTARTLPREAFGSAMAAGLRYVAMSPNLGKILARGFAFGLTGGSVLALLPVVASDLLQGGPLTYGLLLGAFGIGAVGGALLSARLHRMLSAEWIVRLSFLGFAICTWCLAVGISPLIAGFGLLIGGACWVLALSLFNVTVQLSAPRWVVGRALSVYQTCLFGGMAAGSWLWGLAGDHFGLQVALAASGVSLILGGLLGLVLPLPPRVELNLDPANRWQEPHVMLDIQPRSGPIAIAVEYLIRPEDVPEFLDLMGQRKRIRQRNGAHDWTLSRDLGQPELWLESYRTPTWVDYVRHNQRLTHSEAEVVDRIRALHQGPDGPKVRRRIERPTDWLHVVPAHATMEPPH